MSLLNHGPPRKHGLSGAAWVAVAGIILSGCTQSPVKYDETSRVNARAGKELRLRRTSETDNFCVSRPVSFIIEKPPSHGTLSQRPESYMITSMRVGTVDCTGKIANGTALYFLPAPGFQGTDEVEFAVNISGRGLVSNKITIDVTP